MESNFVYNKLYLRPRNWHPAMYIFKSGLTLSVSSSGLLTTVSAADKSGTILMYIIFRAELGSFIEM
jgi:hypothetical protein